MESWFVTLPFGSTFLLTEKGESPHAIDGSGCMMAQLNPTNSLAVAVMAMGRSFPFRVKAQKRLYNRFWHFTAMVAVKASTWPNADFIRVLRWGLFP
jgi:hypothetical protein